MKSFKAGMSQYSSSQKTLIGGASSQPEHIFPAPSCGADVRKSAVYTDEHPG
jgi:hypothetical protein